MESGNITVSVAELIEVFRSLIHESRTREEISDWASLLIQMEDDDRLFYDPLSDEELIWSCITYLSGVDLMESSSKYLHVVEDYIKFFHQKFPNIEI